MADYPYSPNAAIAEDLMKYLLRDELGPSLMTVSAYDTAWIARLENDLGEKALNWLRKNQLPDGSWGAVQPYYHHERAICTVAAMLALKLRGNASDEVRIQRAQYALKRALEGLECDPAGETIGFEMLLPTLVEDATNLGIMPPVSSAMLAELREKRARKLKSLPHNMINRAVTVAFSTEMIGPDGLHLLDLDDLQEGNGSIAYSPAATVFYLNHVRPDDPAANKYLYRIASDGTAPYITPIEIFERGWTLWNLSLLRELSPELRKLAEPHADFIADQWIPGRGISACADLTLIDGDTTGLVYDAMLHFGRHLDLQGVLSYETDTHFRCFPLEANPSISTNIHILGALRQAGCGPFSPHVKKVVEFLADVRTLDLYWFDKWHASPYYPTAHAIINGLTYMPELVENAVHWIVDTQMPDGSWGYYMSTAEETAYCLQALAIWKRSGHYVPDDILLRGVRWLEAHKDEPYPPLWIGKCLYSPILAVKSAVLCAPMLVEEVIGTR